MVFETEVDGNANVVHDSARLPIIGRLMAAHRARKKRKKHMRNVRHSSKHGARRSKRRKTHKVQSRRGKARRGGIRYTKNGQPYKIMPNGRARFLKKN